jgi:hypothetical protein
MLWMPFRRAVHNPIFQGGLESFGRQHTRWTHGLNYLAALSLVLFVTWPKEGFLSLRDLPFTYNALGGSVLIILAYLNLSQGARPLLHTRDLRLGEWLALSPIHAGVFLRGYLAVGCLELLFFWSLSCPLMVLAAGVAGESLAHLGAGIVLTLVCLVSYRMVGIALLLWFERDEFILYVLVRLLYVCFILISGFIAPLSNPVLAFADTSLWPRRLGTLMVPGVALQGWVATVGLHLLLGGLFFIIALIRVRWLQRRALTPGPTEGETSYG